MQMFFSKTFFLSFFLCDLAASFHTHCYYRQSISYRRTGFPGLFPDRPTLLSIKFSGLIKVGNTIPHSFVYQIQSFLVACDLLFLGEE